jgi:hypothetical protein
MNPMDATLGNRLRMVFDAELSCALVHGAFVEHCGNEGAAAVEPEATRAFNARLCAYPALMAVTPWVAVVATAIGRSGS